MEHLWWLDIEISNDNHDRDSTKVWSLSTIPAVTATRYNGPLYEALLLAQDILKGGQAAHGSRKIVVRAVFSKVSGFVARADFLKYRMHGALNVHSASSLLDALSAISDVQVDGGGKIGTFEELLDFLTPAIGTVTSVPLKIEGIESFRKSLDDEFAYRLSVPWITKEPIKPCRVFWVQGRTDIESSRQFYEAAKELGITLVVLDQPGHWMEADDGPHAHYREAFIAISVEGDEGLTRRIVEAVRSYPHKVDGIVTISDVRLPYVAQACEILGLPTSPSSAYFLAGDKGATRELENAALGTVEGFVLKSEAELNTVLAHKGETLKYPLIVKPCMGWNSDCVVKVQNADELYTAVRRASARHAQSSGPSTKVVVEPYIDGPEVDANFIILDGEVLFCDISDDFPSPGDLSVGGNTTSANFMETLMDVPTKLPEDEKDILRSALQASVRRLGFQSGIFHCEARVRDSRTGYVLDAGGILDLQVPEKVVSAPTPTCYLHEVNARSPGYINCVAALLAYGIDYYAIRLLMSLGPQENHRVYTFSQPFHGGKPQYTLGVVVLPPSQAGIMASEDAVQEYIWANPDLVSNIVHYQTLRKKGEYVEGPDSSELLAVGYIIVASKSGRHECLQLSKRIRDSFTYKLEDDSQ